MSTFRLRWRFFWSRRSHRRTSLALLLLLISLLAITYVALPRSAQTQIQDGVEAVARGIHTFGLRNALICGVALCLVVCLLLIFLPAYSRHSYLAVNVSIIPPVSVYLDAENQLSEAAIRPFTQFLIKHLDGRRADLLYFLDASHTANGDKYKTLYRFGFRPVDVPHDPTGKGHVKEAVDRELAMHAYERAVLGPPEQEFIIVTGDADFVPLIYRLVALGHRVQVWAAPVREAYKVVETYLGINVIDLSQRISEIEIAPQEATIPTTNARNRRKKRSTRGNRSSRMDMATTSRIVAPSTLLKPGEEHLYYAIAETLAAHAYAHERFRGDNEKNGAFHSLLRGKYGPRLAGVGYSAGNWIDYWLEHLTTLGILLKDDSHAFPKHGSANEEYAARSLCAIAEMATQAAVLVSASHPDGLVRMSEIATTIAMEPLVVEEAAELLFDLVAPTNRQRITHTRYFVRSARALGLLEFDDVSDSLDVIRNPRLPVRESQDDGVDTTEMTVASNPQPDIHEATVQVLASGRVLSQPLVTLGDSDERPLAP